MSPVASFDTFIVEIEFTPGSWTNVTQWVSLGDDICEWGAGRTSAFDAVQTGVASFVLINTDGRFTPNNPTLSTGGGAAPYFPHVAENIGVRIRATHSAVTYDLWRGVINSWLPRFSGAIGSWSKVTVSCSDRSKFFQRKVLDDSYTEQARYLGAAQLFPLDTGSTDGGVADDLSNDVGKFLIPNDSAAAASVSFLALDDVLPSGGGVKMSTSDPLGALSPALRFLRHSGGTFRAYSFFARLDGGGVNAVGRTSLIQTPEFNVEYAGDHLDLQVAGYRATAGMSTSTVSLDGDFADDTWHHFLFSVILNGTGDITVAAYVDGLLSNVIPLGGTTGAPTVFGADNMSLHLFDVGSKSLDYGSTSYSGLAIFKDGSRLQSDIGGSALDLTGLGAETAGLRFKRVARWCGVADADIGFDAGTPIVGPAKTQGQDALTVMQDLATVTSGLMYVKPNGTIYLSSAAARERVSSALDATYDLSNDADAGSVTLSLADESVATRVTGSGLAGDVIADNGVTLPNGGTVTDSVSGPWEFLADTGYAAQKRLSDRESAHLRYPGLVITPHTATTDLWASLAQRRLDDLIKTTGLIPAQLGGVTEILLFIEGYHWKYSIAGTEVTFDTSLFDRTNAPTLFDDAQYGVFGSTPGANTVTTLGCLTGTGLGTFTVTGETWANRAGTAKIDAEVVAFSGVVAGVFTVTARGQLGTIPAPHTGTPVIELYPTPTFAI